MPQLETTYILMIYLWTWLVIYMTTQKIKMFVMTNPQKHTTTKKQTPTPLLPWL